MIPKQHNGWGLRVDPKNACFANKAPVAKSQISRKDPTVIVLDLFLMRLAYWIMGASCPACRLPGSMLRRFHAVKLIGLYWFPLRFH